MCAFGRGWNRLRYFAVVSIHCRIYLLLIWTWTQACELRCDMFVEQKSQNDKVYVFVSMILNRLSCWGWRLRTYWKTYIAQHSWADEIEIDFFFYRVAQTVGLSAENFQSEIHFFFHGNFFNETLLCILYQHIYLQQHVLLCRRHHCCRQ